VGGGRFGKCSLVAAGRWGALNSLCLSMGWVALNWLSTHERESVHVCLWAGPLQRTTSCWAGLLSFLSEALNNLQLPTLLLPISRQFLCLLDNTISRCYL
jgi:hypothetical protein